MKVIADVPVKGMWFYTTDTKDPLRPTVLHDPDDAPRAAKSSFGWKTEKPHYELPGVSDE